MDLSDKGSVSEDMMSQRERENSESQLKACADCATTKTPLWRGGPAGPKSLCNACGIRSRKKRRALVGLDKKLKKSSENKNQCSNSSTSSSGDSTSSSSNGSLLKKKLLPFGRQVVALQRSRSSSTHKLGEVEQAAFLLMALSCSSVYA